MFQDTVIQPLLSHLTNENDSVALCIDGKEFSYSQLHDRVEAIRDYVRTQQSPLMGIIAYDDIDTYASILALWIEGRGYVPLHPLQPVARLNNIVEQVGLDVILTPKETPVGLASNIITTCSLHTSSVQQPPRDVPDTQPAYILFTSGSTGNPKGVPVTRGNVAGWADAFDAMGMDVSRTDRCLQMFDLTFDLSVGSFLPAFLHGASLYTVAPGRVKYQEVFCLMDEYSLTFALMVPSVIHYLRHYVDELNDTAMRHCLFCGEALNADDARVWRQAVPNARLWNVYGPTEDTIFCTVYELDDHPKDVNGTVCIGKAMRNNLTAIVDDNGHFLREGELGELCLSGRQLTPGYWNDEANNRKAFFMVDGRRWYRTGDICSLDGDGDILYYGRNDSQVKIQGFRVELGEIEHAARNFFHGERNAVAIAVEDKSGNAIIRLAIEGSAMETGELKEFLSGVLPQYMLPHDFMFIEHFPQNANNKIDRKAIKKMIK